MLPPTCTIVLNDPQMRPLAYHVLKMRLSLLSIGPSTSGEGPPMSLGRQLVTRQSRSGTLPAFCSENGGTPYGCVTTVRRASVSATRALSSERVLRSDQKPMRLERPE